MFTTLVVLIVIVCVMLILVVLLQNSKGGGLAANFASAQIMGVRRTADLLERATWILAAVLVGLCILSTYAASRSTVEAKKSIIQEQINNEVPSGNMNIPATQAPADSAK